MKTQSKDFKVPAYLITLAIMFCFTVLPFQSEIWAEITEGSPMATTLAQRNAYYDMSRTEKVIVHVDWFTIKESADGTHEIWLDNRGEIAQSLKVETDLDEQAQAELFYTKEEIQVRVSGNRVSIIAGDNGEF